MKNNELPLENNADLLRKDDLRGVAQDITEKKLLELEKEALIKHLNYALDASGDGIWDWTPADGIVVFSKAWVEMLGYKVGELDSLASEWSDRVHPDDAEWVFAAINKIAQSAANGDTLSNEYRFRNKTGDYLWIRNKAKIVERNEKGEASRVVGTHTNISEQKEAEEEIKRTTLLLEAAQQLAKMGAWELDLATGRTYWTDEVYSIHEIEKDFDHNNANGIEFYHPDYRQVIKKAITDSIEQQIPFDVKCKFITAQNNQRWVHVSGYPVIKEGKLTHLIGMIKDITQEEADKEAIVKEQMFSKQLLENMADGISVVDIEGNQIVVNKAFCEMTGFSEDELIGQTAPFSYWPVEEIAKIDIAFQQTLAGATGTFELTFQKKNGKRFPVQISVSTLKDVEGNIINYLGTVKDITEQKRAEIELKTNEERFRSILNNLNAGIVVHASDTSIKESNRMASELLGLSEEQINGKKALDPDWKFLNEDGNPLPLEKYPVVQIIDTKLPLQNFELGINRPVTNDVVWVAVNGFPVLDNQGELIEILISFIDITEQKKSEQALKESEMRLSLATQVGGIGVFDWDIVNNKLTWDNQMFDLYGVKREAFTSAVDAWSNGVYEADREQGKLELELALKGEKEFNTEFRIQHPSGEIRNVRALGTVIRDAEGKAIRMIGTNWDITKEKEALRQIEQAKEQAEAASKAKSEFLANMSHEIRTPLNGVIGFTDLLTQTPLSSVQQQYANSANVSGNILLGIINDILDFSKIEAGMLELEVIKTDMVELLENSIDIVKFSVADKKLELVLDIDPSMPRFAHIDAIRTTQILANILSNAIKFTHKGEVVLKVVYQALERNKGKLSFSIRDTGVGITEEQKAKLFKSFSQADSTTTRKFGGTGLGLVISQMIAEKMGSKINIDSSAVVGTTFYFDIITNFEEGEKLDATKIAGVKRCLIIDDNDTSRLILEKMLQHWQIESDSCSNGFQALQKLESSKSFDVIICDYDMPYFNGIETIRLMKDKLKLNNENQAFILLHSSLDDAELNQRSKELGIRFRLNKPVKSQDLINVLDQLDQEVITITQQETIQTRNVSISSGKIKILIAEDNSLNMILSKTMIAQLMPDCEVYEAGNGLEAIEQYKSISPDLIFMDVHMPGLDGIEATKKIRALEVNTSNPISIIALTAGALKEGKEKCLAAGMDDFLTKPLEFKKIQTVLNKFFQQGKKVNADVKNIEAKNELHFGFSELVASIGNDPKVAQKLIWMAITDMPTMIDQLERAYNAIDLANMRSIAHSIAGSSLSMRCNILADIARKIENDTDDNSFESLKVLFTELKEEWETVKNLLLQKNDH